MKTIFNILIISSLVLMFSSCAVEGDDVSGVWFTNGELGKMKIEVRPSGGTFEGYLLEYEEKGKMVAGGKSKDNLIFTGLRFKNDKYLGGTFLKAPKGNSACVLKLAYRFDAKESMKAAYLCSGGANRLEYWYRDKYHDKPVLMNNVNTVNLEDLLKANPNNKDK